ncbi:MAG TPA: hypothetical protein VK920_03560 [Solirubrobacterales bacterium]|nr:hypothetical protein [Solirubrobacterales bacterium]
MARAAARFERTGSEGEPLDAANPRFDLVGSLKLKLTAYIAVESRFADVVGSKRTFAALAAPPTQPSHARTRANGSR